MIDAGDTYRTAFAQAFSDAIAARKVSLSWLHRRLKDRATPVSLATLSYWRSGERHPEGLRSLTALEEIEDLLGLDGGVLTDLVNMRIRLGPLSPAQNPFTEWQISQAAHETLEILAAPPIQIIRELSAHVVSDVDENGLLRRRTSREHIQAVVPFVHEITYGVASADYVVFRPDFTVRGATLVRDHLHKSAHVYACVLRLDRPLILGATAMLEIAMLAPAPQAGELQTGNEAGTFAIRPIRDLLIWTRFHPDAVPDWVDGFERTQTSDGLVTTPLTPRESIHLARRDFGPGIIGIRWGFDH